MRCSEQLVRSKVKIFLLFLIIFSFSYGETVIHLKKEAFITKEKVYLSDIATVKSDNPRLKSFLESIPIFISSAETVITAKQIEDILRKNYVNLNLIRIVGNQVRLTKKELFITQEYLKKEIIYYLSSEYKDVRIKDVRCSFKPFKVKSIPEIKLFSRSKSSSHIYLTATVYSDKEVLKKINCTVKYGYLINAVVAKRDLMKGHVIEEGDVEIKKIELKRGVITSIDTAKGAVAKTFIKKGTVLKTSMVEIDYPVKKKDYVRVIYDRKGIRIEITGQALENGMIGQSIKVKNLSTGKLLRCRVIGRNTVLFISGY